MTDEDLESVRRIKLDLENWPAITKNDPHHFVAATGVVLELLQESEGKFEAEHDAGVDAAISELVTLADNYRADQWSYRYFTGKSAGIRLALEHVRALKRKPAPEA